MKCLEHIFSRIVSKRKNIMVCLLELNSGTKVLHAWCSLSALTWQNTDGKALPNKILNQIIIHQLMVYRLKAGVQREKERQRKEERTNLRMPVLFSDAWIYFTSSPPWNYVQPCNLLWAVEWWVVTFLCVFLAVSLRVSEICRALSLFPLSWQLKTLWSGLPRTLSEGMRTMQRRAPSWPVVGYTVWARNKPLLV